jgi:hypothetical protein
MRGAISQLPNTPSWRGAQLKAEGQLYFTFIFKKINVTGKKKKRKINLMNRATSIYNMPSLWKFCKFCGPPTGDTTFTAHKDLSHKH